MHVERGGVRPDGAAGFEASWKQARDIDGWLTREQALALYRAAQAAPRDTAVVEIGSHHGKSTVLLAAARSDAAPVVAIDPFEDPRWGGGASGLPLFLENLEAAGVQDRVRTMRTTSAAASRAWSGESIGLLYIDGAHDLGSVLQDIDGWSGLVAPGGRLAIHDAFSSVGVTAAIMSRFPRGRRFRYLGSVRSLAIFERVDMTPGARLGNAARLSARVPWFAKNLFVRMLHRLGASRSADWVNRYPGQRFPY